MTDLSYPYGSSVNIPLNLFESDGVTPLDNTGGIIKWWVNDSAEDGISYAEIVKRSYFGSEVLTVDESLGQYVIIVRSEDNRLSTVTRHHCAEVIKRGSATTAAGTIDVTTGGTLITGAGLATDEIFDGDILVPAGIAAENQVPITVDKELDANGVPTGNLITDYTGFSAESGISVQFFTGLRPQVTGVSGDYVITPC